MGDTVIPSEYDAAISEIESIVRSAWVQSRWRKAERRRVLTRAAWADPAQRASRQLAIKAALAKRRKAVKAAKSATKKAAKAPVDGTPQQSHRPLLPHEQLVCDPYATALFGSDK